MRLRQAAARRRIDLLATRALPGLGGGAGRPPTAGTGRRPPSSRSPRRVSTGKKSRLTPSSVTIDDGDSVVIHWPGGDVETVRILGIDTPETRHDEHGIPSRPAVRARGDGPLRRGASPSRPTSRLIRAGMLDPYGRTLAYLILNGKNYSVLAIRARLSDETVSHYGDNGLPELAAEVKAAARSIGPLPFEPPHVFRKRMRALSDWEGAAKREPQR